jgi:hypothetical protein
MIPNRLFIASAVVLGLALTARAAAAAQIASYGFRTGIASSTILGDFDEGNGSDYRNGFSGSLYCQFRLNHLLSIQPELGWTSKGDEGAFSVTYIPPTGPPTPVTIDYPLHRRIDYLEIPVLLRIGAPSGSFFEPYLVMGPGVAFRTGEDVEVEGAPDFGATPNARIRMASIYENIGTFDNPNYRDVDWSAIAGGGLAMGSWPFRVVVDTRFALGLVGTFASAEHSFAHNGSWITTIGIQLR